MINVNKPSGPTSRQVVQEIKDIFKLKRCGHAGTLDPRVSGVLVVALENATKVMPVLMGLDKEYEGILYLHKDVNKKTLEKTISKHFIGEITQTPPVKSRVARRPRKRPERRVGGVTETSSVRTGPPSPLFWTPQPAQATTG